MADKLEGEVSEDQNETPESKPEAENPVKFTKAQQDFINGLVARETKKAFSKAEEEAQAIRDADKKKQMREALKEQQKFEELSANLQEELRAANEQIAELESALKLARASADKYESLVDTEYADFVENMPAALRVFDPGADSTIEEKRLFMESARKAQSELGEPYRPGVPPSPEPKFAPINNSGYDREVQERMNSSVYSRIRG